MLGPKMRRLKVQAKFIDSTIDKNLDTIVDESKLKQILTKLIDNAIENCFNSNTILIILNQLAPVEDNSNNGIFSIMVRDYGKGISPEQNVDQVNKLLRDPLPGSFGLGFFSEMAR